METEDGNEDVCGACTDIGDLICCESCPAAYHADCAGYVSPQEVPAGDWYCWSCCIQRKRGFPFPTTRFRQELGSTVFVGVEGRLDSFYRGTLEHLGSDNCTVLYKESEGDARIHKREQLGRRNHRLWHGTADPKAWEKGSAPFEWHPLSRRYAVAQSVKAAALSASQSASQPAAPASATAPAASPAPAKRQRSCSNSRSNSGSISAPVQPVRASSASLPQPASVSFMAPAAVPSRGPSLAPRSILVGSLVPQMPITYRPHAPAIPSFPPSSSQAAGHFPSTKAAPTTHSRSKGKKGVSKKRRRSKAASSSEEDSSSSSSEDQKSDSANSDTHDSDFGAGSASNHKRHKHVKQKTANSNEGVMSRQDEEEFYEALTKFWSSQGSSGKRILAKYQPFETMRLTSGMPTFGAHHFWAAVMAIGGHALATEKKGWAGVGRLFSPPRSMTTISHTFKSAYEKLLLPFEEATRKGQTGLAVPRVTGKLPPISAVKARQPQTAFFGGHEGPSSSGHSFGSRAQSDESDSDSDAPRDRQKYLRVMTQSRGRVKDYGESPVKRARLALEGFTWGCPSLPTAADLAGLDEVMVAPEAVMSQQAADLAPGTHVEYRSREAYLIGGWFRAKIVQVAAGSAAEGGRRFLLDCTDFDADSWRAPQGIWQAPQGTSQAPQGSLQAPQGNWQEWVPLVYPDANGHVPHVMLRLPLQPERPPTADKKWKTGDRVEGFWQNAWWTSTVKDIEADDTVVCLSDATPVYPEGEEWEVERENVRAGHPQEASGFGMLSLDSAPVAVHKTAWGEKIRARKFRVDGFTIEAFSCQLHMGAADSAPPEEDSRQQVAARQPSPPPPPRKSPSRSPSTKSPSPGSASGTTQSASPEDRNPLEPADHPGANPSEAASPSCRQDLADAAIQGHTVTTSVTDALSGKADALTGKGSVAQRAGHKSGQGTFPDALAPAKQEAAVRPSMKKRGATDSGNTGSVPPSSNGDSDMQGSLALQHAVKVEFEESAAQHAKQARVKPEQTESGAQWETEEGRGAGHHGQGHPQKPPQVQHPQHAWKPPNSNHQGLGGSINPNMAPSQPDWPHPEISRGFTFTSQPLSHAQRLSPEPSSLGAADAEAQLFFMPQRISLAAAHMMAPKPSGISLTQAPVKAISLQEQQQRLYDMQLRQEQALAQQRRHHQMLLHQQQRQQAPDLQRDQQQFRNLQATQGLWVPHLQKHLAVTAAMSSQHAQHSMHTSSLQPEPPPGPYLNGQAAPVQTSFGPQHAQHGGSRGSNQQQSQQQAQHASGLNGFSNPSMHSGQATPRGNGGTSTAFVMWVDGQYKAHGQQEKRMKLRQFVQAARGENANSQQLSKLLIELVGENMIREWQAIQRAGLAQGPSSMNPPMAKPQPAHPHPAATPYSSASPGMTHAFPPASSGMSHAYLPASSGTSNPFQPQLSGDPAPYTPFQPHHSAEAAQHSTKSNLARGAAEQFQSQMPMQHPIQHMAVHSQMHAAQMSQSLMQQASAMLIKTNQTLQGLRKQHYTDVHLDSIESCRLQHGNGYTKPTKEPSTVEIVDVTDEVAHHNKSTDALPFPAVTLPF